MKILLGLTYFKPYSSGLSEYAMRLGRALVKLGHEVKLICARHNPELSLVEMIEGVEVHRVPVSLKISKGVLMPALKTIAKDLIGWADVVNLHLPQFESYLLSNLCRRSGKPLVVTYHCDLEKRGNIFTQLPYIGTRWLNQIALSRAKTIVQSSVDYAQTSPALKKHLQKVHIIVPPIESIKASANDIENLRDKFDLDEAKHYIGLSGRVAAEKGYEILIGALPEILTSYPNTEVVHAGSWKGVVGEEAYQAQIDQMLKPFESKWKKLGYLDDNEFRAFFSVIDCLIVSSTNRTEAFGMVQIEAFAQGTPVIASDLPGIRVPVTESGMGLTFKPGEAKSLAQTVKKLLSVGKKNFLLDRNYLEKYAETAVAAAYLKLFEEVSDE